MTLSSILTLAIIFLVFIIIILTVVYFAMTVKENSNKSPQTEQPSQTIKKQEKIGKSYSKESVFNFMEFEKIEDNMIVQKNGKKFLMVVECQGINYDLMSDIEKTSVENGFIQFLNSLRDPLQIHIQTRTVNLEDSLKRYREKLKKIENDLMAKETKYKSMVELGKYSDSQLRAQLLEIKRQRNLYEYGRDVISNTERMSMNKNVLRKKYYLILSYYHNDAENEGIEDYEISEQAFSNLYTRSQSLIRALSISGVSGRVLNSYELVELMYNAYNRDEAENYGIERAENAEYDSLYITSQDILQKRMVAIEKEIQNRALDLAKDSIKYANEELRETVEKKEKNLETLAEELAMDLIGENEDYLTNEVAEEAKKQVKRTRATRKKGGQK